MNDSFIKHERQARPRGPRRAPGRVAAIAEASLRVFTRQGWRLAQVADVAAEAGVAAGTVYLYAADKEALLGLALRAAAGLPLPAEDELPAGRLPPGLLAGALERLALPRLAAFADGGAADAGTLRTLVEELYDCLDRQRRLVLLLDRLAPERPDVGDAYGATVRARALNAFAVAVDRLAVAGFARRDVDAAAASRAAVEMVAWMALRRPADPQPPACDDAAARHATVAMTVAALERR